jgi:hypothetical protein
MPYSLSECRERHRTIWVALGLVVSSMVVLAGWAIASEQNAVIKSGEAIQRVSVLEARNDEWQRAMRHDIQTMNARLESLEGRVDETNRLLLQLLKSNAK